MKIGFGGAGYVGRIVLALGIVVLGAGGAQAQVSITTLETALTQNFDSLATTGPTATLLPTGWLFVEAAGTTGNNANTSYSVGSGSSQTGDTYSWGTGTNTDRAFGTLLSGSVVSTIGATFQNNASGAIGSLSISYNGEQWRLGAGSRVDRLDFQYSLNATSLTTGDWTDVDALDFTAPLQVGVGPYDGNLAVNRVAKSFVINGLSIAVNAKVWIRWNDLNATGSDDGLGIDDFSLTAHPVPPDPVLYVIKVASAAAPTLPGDAITYEVEIGHELSSTEDAANVVFSDALPAGVTAGSEILVAGTTTELLILDLGDSNMDGAGISVADVITVDLGPLEFGDTFELLFEVSVDARTTAGTIANSASAAYGGALDGGPFTAITEFPTSTPVVACASESDCAEDLNPCTTRECNLGGCGFGFNTASCNDGNACTDGDACASGQCVGGSTPSCDDGKPCTDDSCAPATGCVHSNDDLNVCSNGDANACTTGDTCSAGDCVAGTTAVVCNDNKVCTDDSCDPQTGCAFQNDDGNACSDDNACTDGDSCQAGTCVAGTTPLACNDGKPCTDDSCNPGSGCVFSDDNSNVCTTGDANACTTGDTCVGGNCVAGTTALTCDDGKPCTDDSCDPQSGCVFVADNGNVCTTGDANACTTGDTCSAGNCVAGTAAVVCTDNKACTDDACLPASGCAFANDNSNPCSDDNLMTAGDACNAGTCVGTTIVCTLQPNACQETSFNGASCTLVAKAGNPVCDDGSTLTADDKCMAGVCGGTIIVCPAPTQCENTVTPNGVGCTTSFKTNTATCDDGLATTANDKCDGQGACAGTTIVCAAPTQCETAGVPNGTSCPKGFKSNTTACNDSNASTSNDKCDGQGGCAGTTIVCPTPGQCQTAGVPDGASCVPGNKPGTATCDDGSVATHDDKCNGQGACVGSTIQCPAATACGDYTANGVDCTFAPRSGSCDDALVTTHHDVCVDGACKGTPYACAPSQCELTSVANGVDCTITPKSPDTLCNDGRATTRDDHCDGNGDCAGTAYSCTPRLCEATSVADGADCVATPAMPGTDCDDLDPCTGDDQCDGASACRGRPVDCGTGESCDLAGECQVSHCTTCGDSAECGAGSDCLAQGGDNRCLVSCSGDDDCALSQVCRRHGEGTLRCFDADGACGAPMVDPEPDPEVVEAPDEVEVVEVEPDVVEPGPEVVEPQPESGPEPQAEWMPEAIETVDTAPTDVSTGDTQAEAKPVADGGSGCAGAGGLPVGLLSALLALVLARRRPI